MHSHLLLGSPPLAVIPGLAPGIVAILPQLLFLLIASLTLIVSPRTWWRLLRSCTRHPLRALLVTSSVAILTLAVAGLWSIRPRARPGEPIADRTNGFARSDPRATATCRHGAGPLARPNARAIELGGAVRLPARPIPLAPRRALLCIDDDRLIAFDLDAGTEGVAIDLLGTIELEPLPYAREIEGRAHAGLAVATRLGEQSVVVILQSVAPTTPARLPSRERLAQFELPAPAGAIALAGDRLLVACDSELLAFSLAEPQREAPLFRVARMPARTAGLAADENGVICLLDERGLHRGDLDGAPLELVTRIEGAPVGLALRSGLAFTLESVREPDGDSRAILRSIDPVFGERWSVSIDRALASRPVATEHGVVVATRTGFERRDAKDGSLAAAVTFPAPPACDLVVTETSVFALLDDGTVLRHSPGLERIAWSRGIARDDESVEASPSGHPSDLETSWLVVADRSLLVQFRGAMHHLVEADGATQLAWSHAHGGPDRTAAEGGAEIPLLASLLFTAELPGTCGGPMLPIHASDIDSRSARSWLVPRAESDRCRLVRVLEGGATESWLDVPGDLRGFILLDSRVILALAIGEEGRLLAFDSESRERTALWDRPVGPLASCEVLAGSEGSVAVALQQSIVVLSADDGTRRYELALEPRGAPLLDGERLVAVGRDAGGPAILAFDADRPLWRRELDAPSELHGSASLRGDLLCAVASLADGRSRILSLDPGSGALHFVAEFDEQLEGSLAISADAIVHASKARAGWLGHDGEPAGSISLDAPVEDPEVALPRKERSRSARSFAVVPGIVLRAAGRSVAAIDTATGDVIWSFEAEAPIDSLLADGDRVLISAGSELLALGAEE